MEIIIAIFGIIVLILIFCFVLGAGDIFRPPSNDEIGERGEIEVARALENNCKNSYFIHDIIVVDDRTKKSAQIDHVVIRSNGVFIIETKNYAGRIYGRDEQREWTQVLAYGKTKNRFYNPIKQNNNKIFYLQKILKMKNIFVPVVVFPRAELYAESNSLICDNLGKLAMILDSDQNINLTDEQMTKIYLQLLEIKDNPQITKEEHIENIHKIQDDLANNICPRCGKSLVLRNGKNGQFYGCLGYPDCRFTKRLQGDS